MDLREAPAEEAPDEGIVGDAGNAVRIYTVHGAKGLESPVVWLLDAASPPDSGRGYDALVDWPPEDAAPRRFSLSTVKDELSTAQQAIVDSEKRARGARGAEPALRGDDARAAGVHRERLGDTGQEARVVVRKGARGDACGLGRSRRSGSRGRARERSLCSQSARSGKPRVPEVAPVPIDPRLNAPLPTGSAVMTR